MPVSKLRVTKDDVLVAIIETSSTPEELSAERYAGQDVTIVVVSELDAAGRETPVAVVEAPAETPVVEEPVVEAPVVTEEPPAEV